MLRRKALWRLCRTASLQKCLPASKRCTVLGDPHCPAVNRRGTGGCRGGLLPHPLRRIGGTSTRKTAAAHSAPRIPAGTGGRQWRRSAGLCPSAVFRCTAHSMSAASMARPPAAPTAECYRGSCLLSPFCYLVLPGQVAWAPRWRERFLAGMDRWSFNLARHRIAEGLK